jgi:formylglycine-generating enzyme required for sulfatase activity
MVPVTGGTLPVGSPGVTISSSRIDNYEVTYELCTDVRAWTVVRGHTDLVTGQSGNNTSASNNPVTAVDWFDAVKWCNARSEKDGLVPVYYTSSARSTVYRTGELTINIDAVDRNANGYRLATEAERHFAARVGNSSQGYTDSGGDIAGNVAWYNGSSGRSTHTVGTRSANELGLYDMSGNGGERTAGTGSVAPIRPAAQRTRGVRPHRRPTGCSGAVSSSAKRSPAPWAPAATTPTARATVGLRRGSGAFGGCPSAAGSGTVRLGSAPARTSAIPCRSGSRVKPR